MTKNTYHYLAEFLGKRIKEEMVALSIDQKTLAQRSEQSQSTISNIVSGKTNVSMKTIFYVMEILGMDPLLELGTYSNNITNPPKVSDSPASSLEFKLSPNLIYDPANIAFRGQTGHFYVYFHSTNPHDTHMIRGDLTLFQENDFCRVKLQINTEPHLSENGKDYYKTYDGYAFISPLQHSIYIILMNHSIGELSFLIYPYDQILRDHSQLECTIAMALTVSAGLDSRLPTSHRIFLSRKLLDSEAEKHVSSQLLMNKSVIRISKENFEKMVATENLRPDFLSYCEKHFNKEMYFEIEEDMLKKFIRSNLSYFEDLCTLRRYTNAPKNNKINESITSYIYHWLSENNF